MVHVLQTKLLITGTNFIHFSVCHMRRVNSRELIYKKFGDPLQVIEMIDSKLPRLGKHDVRVRMLAAPVNPADINTIQGKYPIKPKLPTVAGSEGVGIVTDVGEDVKNVITGNKVIITKPAQGTWRNIAIFNKNVIRCIPHELGLAEAATLTVNPCCAYRMLTDFVPVREKRNLVVIQNGANSSCGQNVIQLCKVWGIKTVNVVRERPDIEQLKEYLRCLGATHVLTEEELKKTDIFKNKQIDSPVLAINCVGGPSCLGIMKRLAHSGTMVTYGGMSKKPVSIPTGYFIFKNLSFLGFWLSAWNKKKTNRDAKDKMFTEIINLFCENKLQAPVHKMVAFDKFKEALDNSLNSKGKSGCKYIIDFQKQ